MIGPSPASIYICSDTQTLAFGMVTSIGVGMGMGMGMGISEITRSILYIS